MQADDVLSRQAVFVRCCLEMVGYVSGFMIFMLGSLALAFVGGISGFVMTIITLVVRNFRMVWIPVVSMIASIVACIVTCAVL